MAQRGSGFNSHKSRLGKPAGRSFSKKNQDRSRKGPKDEYIYGKNAVKAVLRAGKREVFKVLVSAAGRDEMIKEISKTRYRDIEFETVETGLLDVLCGKEDHRGWLIKCSSIPVKDFQSLKEFAATAENFVILDRITDPGNFGAIVRNAVFFGFTNFVYTETNAVSPNPTVAAVSAGALEQANLFQVPNLANTIRLLKTNNFMVYGTDLKGTPVSELSKDPKFALVLGNEKHGMRRLTGELCDANLTIIGSGRLDSLNVASSSAIFFQYLAAN